MATIPAEGLPGTILPREDVSGNILRSLQLKGQQEEAALRRQPKPKEYELPSGKTWSRDKAFFSKLGQETIQFLSDPTVSDQAKQNAKYNFEQMMDVSQQNSSAQDYFKTVLEDPSKYKDQDVISLEQYISPTVWGEDLSVAFDKSGNPMVNGKNWAEDQRFSEFAGIKPVRQPTKWVDELAKGLDATYSSTIEEGKYTTKSQQLAVEKVLGGLRTRLMYGRGYDQYINDAALNFIRDKVGDPTMEVDETKLEQIAQDPEFIKYVEDSVVKTAAAGTPTSYEKTEDEERGSGAGGGLDKLGIVAIQDNEGIVRDFNGMNGVGIGTTPITFPYNKKGSDVIVSVTEIILGDDGKLYVGYREASREAIKEIADRLGMDVNEFSQRSATDPELSFQISDALKSRPVKYEAVNSQTLTGTLANMQKRGGPGTKNELVDAINQLTGGVPNAPQKQQTNKTIKRSDLKAKAAAAGYTESEYIKMLRDRGVEIID